MKNCNSLGVYTRFAVQKFESVVKYVGFYRRRRESVVKHVGPARFCCQAYSSQISKKFTPWKKWLLQLKLLCGIECFWPWAARGLSGSFENVIDRCQDYSSHISKKFKPWKKWLLQLKLLCGIAFFWPWAARGLSGSFENVIEYQKSAPLSWSGSFLLIKSFKKCTTLVVRLVFAD